MSQPLFPIGNLIPWASCGGGDWTHCVLFCRNFLCQGHSHSVMMESMKDPGRCVQKWQIEDLDTLGSHNSG